MFANPADGSPPGEVQGMKTLTKDQMKWHRQQMKKARRAGLSDLENAHQLVVAIELLGKALHGSGDARLGRVECCLIAFSAQWAPAGETEDPTSSPLSAMLKRVREQRNDYAHEGTAARRLARQAAEVALQLERALLNAETEGRPMKMRDVMITPVICAEDWQTLAHVRRVMLLHEFTILPYRQQDGGWTFIEATEVVRALSTVGMGARNKTVVDAVACGHLRVTPARTAQAGKEVNQSAPETTLIVKGACQTAVGLVTPFDLL